jgi:hypothetical protein
LIGASAIEQGYAVATLNTRHFQKIPYCRCSLFRATDRPPRWADRLRTTMYLRHGRAF